MKITRTENSNAKFQIRRIDLIWQSGEVEEYEQLKAKAQSLDKEIPEFVKEIIQKELSRKRT